MTGLSASIFSDFKNSYLEHLDNLQEAISTKDFQSVKKIAHQLKGSSGNLRIESIMKLADELEACTHNETFDEINQIILELIRHKEHL